jgi:hypothetical protein
MPYPAATRYVVEDGCLPVRVTAGHGVGPQRVATGHRATDLAVPAGTPVRV